MINTYNKSHNYYTDDETGYYYGRATSVDDAFILWRLAMELGYPYLYDDASANIRNNGYMNIGL